MKTKAVRLYGKKDLRVEEFELPEIKSDEILAKVVTDSICMSSYKAAKQAERLRLDFLQRGETFCFETVFSHVSKVDFIGLAKSYGYHLKICLISE